MFLGVLGTPFLSYGLLCCKTWRPAGLNGGCGAWGLSQHLCQPCCLIGSFSSDFIFDGLSCLRQKSIKFATPSSYSSVYPLCSQTSGKSGLLTTSLVTVQLPALLFISAFLCTFTAFFSLRVGPSNPDHSSRKWTHIKMATSALTLRSSSWAPYPNSKSLWEKMWWLQHGPDSSSLGRFPGIKERVMRTIKH